MLTVVGEVQAEQLGIAVDEAELRLLLASSSDSEVSQHKRELLDNVFELSHRVARGKDELTLQPREFRLLEYLMKHAGQVVTRTMLLESVWEYHFDPQTNVIDVHISRLRAKIDKGFETPLLHTVRGVGYVLRD